MGEDIRPVLELKNLQVAFGSSHPVRGVSLTLRPGEKIGLVGESGSGKSLTALSIMRLVRGADLSGQVLLDGEDLLALSPREMARVRGNRVSMIYQDPMSSLNPVRTIGAQLIEAIRLHETVGVRAARARALELLVSVGVPSPQQRLRQYPHQFSGGMRQRVMIAMALAARPKVLIADEPTTALDVTTQARIIELLDRLASEAGTAVVLITHDLGVAAGFCETIHVMQRGEVVESAPAEQLYSRPQHPYSKALLGAVVDLSIDVDKPIPVGEELELSRVSQGAAGSPVEPGEPILTVEGVSKVFRLGRGSVVSAVDDISFSIRKGETLGLVGESGSGKSTLSRLTLALIPADSGRVVFDGEDVNSLPPERLRRLRRRMQMVFQDPVAALNRRQTVEQIIATPLIAHGIGDAVKRREQVLEAMDRVGLPRAFAARLPHTMSGGQCQRVAIARALVLKPDLLVLDESVSALDVSIQAQVLNLLRDLQRELGLTYLFVSHDLAVVRYMSHRIAVMNRGRLVELASREELFSAPKHEYTRTLMAAIPVADPTTERIRRANAAMAAAG